MSSEKAGLISSRQNFEANLSDLSIINTLRNRSGLPVVGHLTLIEHKNKNLKTINFIVRQAIKKAVKNGWK